MRALTMEHFPVSSAYSPYRTRNMKIQNSLLRNHETNHDMSLAFITSLIAALIWRLGLAIEAAGIDEQKKQTGLNTSEVMNDIFSIEN